MARTTSKVTTDHEEIRRWAEERGAKPSAVVRTESDDDPGIIRLDFPGYSGEGSLEEISWDDWFEKFDERGLALLYQETTPGGERSNFNKIVSRETTQAAGEKSSGRGGSRSAAKGSASGSRGRSSSRRDGGSSNGGGSSKSRGSAAEKSGGSSRSSEKRSGTSRSGAQSKQAGS